MAALGLGACARQHPPPLSPAALQATRNFTDIEIYWAGPSFEGIPLTAADRPEDYLPKLGMRVYYGDCVAHRTLLATSGCTLPLEINSVTSTPHINHTLGPQHRIHIHGVPAVVYDGGRSIEVYTGGVAVDVFADTPQRARRAALALRRLNVHRQVLLKRLPAPRHAPGAP
ncbi:MAG TPA: hypothetical protein VGN69_02040 [Solirubrobacteraceae bacterium]|nr:hypothetical protein [Solirubrobacteraceae bacterium]